jgi:hypothetical protein
LESVCPGHRHVDVIAQLVEVGNFANGFRQLLLECLHVVFGQHEIFALTYHVAAHFLGGSGGVLEIPAHCILDLLAAIQQPQHDKQGHHGRNEIRVGHFPGSAMMAGVAALFFDDDDGSLVCQYGSIPGNRRSRRGRRLASVLYEFLRGLKGGSDVAGNRGPADLDSHGRRGAFHESHNHYAQHLVGRMFVVVPFGHVRGDWTHQSVAQQDPEK